MASTSSDRASTASAPGSSANLGPGFDCIGLALDVRCRVTAVPAADWQIRSAGEDPGSRAAAFLRAAAEGVAGPGHAFHLDVDSDVPRGGGLGSSAAVAAATAGAAFLALGQQIDRGRVFNLVADLDGHADNAAAAVYGGLVAVVGRRVLRLQLSPALLPVVAVPVGQLPTTEAREALPESVPHAMAARSVARAVALVVGLHSGLASDLRAAAGDELHEAPRTHLSPRTTELITVAQSAGAVHAGWSGAGPAVFALASREQRSSVAAAFEDALAGEGSVLLPDVDRAGLV